MNYEEVKNALGSLLDSFPEDQRGSLPDGYSDRVAQISQFVDDQQARIDALTESVDELTKAAEKLKNSNALLIAKQAENIRSISGEDSAAEKVDAALEKIKEDMN